MKGEDIKIKIITEDDTLETIEVDAIEDTENGSKVASKDKRRYYSPDGKMYFEVFED